MKKVNVNHVKIAKFVMSKNELNKIKGGNKDCGSSGISCTCHYTTNSGCIDGTGSGSKSML